MAVYIIHTDRTENALAKSPYREYISLLSKSKFPENYDQVFSYPANQENGGFEEEAACFIDPVISFSFHRIHSDDNEERILIRQILSFQYEPHVQESMINEMNQMKKMMRNICIPDAEEYSFQYEISEEEVQMIMNAAVVKENLQKAGITMISLDIAAMAKGW